MGKYLVILKTMESYNQPSRYVLQDEMYDDIDSAVKAAIATGDNFIIAREVNYKCVEVDPDD